ncbi:MAG TPA: ABC transporter ATP-binding protein [Microvirga sp.]|jgi:sn-glycerol 3-phosphate transport system ATP-binding protein|nr:ABC transporter ATP-binding protein [Microvirga sp.]
MADVELSGITKAWGATPAVDDVSFSVAKGHLVAILGPSGCGKSTTLRLVAGLESASSGRIVIAGRDVTGLPPARRGISMVFQSYALFPHLSVAENIVFGLRVRDVPRAERDARLKEAAGILGLEQLLDRKPSQLSGGQQQRVALGRAIVARTPVCLMDEPLSNLDAQLRVEMRREIRDLQRRLGITMLYVTHDQVEAMTMADQVVLMRAGKVEQDAAPAELYERPATPFVARFIGTPPMNVIPLASVGSHPHLARAPGGYAPERLAVGIRPELVRIEDGGVPARVAAAEFLGADTLIETRIDGHPFIVRRPGRVTAGAGETIGLTWDPAQAHWFDLSSERRIDPA